MAKPSVYTSRAVGFGNIAFFKNATPNICMAEDQKSCKHWIQKQIKNVFIFISIDGFFFLILYKSKGC